MLQGKLYLFTLKVIRNSRCSKKLANFFAKSKRNLDDFAAINKNQYKNKANVQYGTNSLPN